MSEPGLAGPASVGVGGPRGRGGGERRGGGGKARGEGPRRGSVVLSRWGGAAREPRRGGGAGVGPGWEAGGGGDEEGFLNTNTVLGGQKQRVEIGEGT